MKQAILLLIGLFVGALAATIVANTLRQRDTFARGLMDVMAHYHGSLRSDMRAQHCDGTRATHALGQLAVLADDIDVAIYPDSTPESAFREFSQRLHDAIAEVPRPAPGDCATLAPYVQKIGKVCEDCHQQYR